jgi:hypothetical protein
MPSLMELLPLIVDEEGKPCGWTSGFIYIPPTRINPGGSLHIGPFSKPGWLRNAFLISDNPHLRVNQTVFHGQRPVSWSFYEAWLYGAVTPGPAGLAWVPKYDTANNIYSMLYQPIPPQEYMEGADIWLTLPERDPNGNPITSPATITLSLHTIILDSRERFTEKLKTILT